MIVRTLTAATLLLGSAAVQAETCQLEIAGDDMMKFDKTELKVAASCTEVSLTLKHPGKMPATAMGHNWVLTKTGDFDAVAKGGASHKDNAYVPPGDARVIAHTKVIGGGETTTVTFPVSKLEKGGDYTFFCSFPGHWTLMKGKLVFG